MQENSQCSKCAQAFDLFNNKPLILPCEHSQCQQCLFEEFKQNQKNVCKQCKSQSKENPNKLLLNVKAIKEIEMREISQYKDKLRNLLQELQNQKNQIKNIQSSSSSFKTNLYVEASKLISKYLNPNRKDNQQKLVQLVRILNQLIILIENALKAEDLSNKLEIESIEELISLKILNEAKNEGKVQVEYAEKQSKKLLSLMKLLFKQILEKGIEKMQSNLINLDLEEENRNLKEQISQYKYKIDLVRDQQYDFKAQFLKEEQQIDEVNQDNRHQNDRFKGQSKEELSQQYNKQLIVNRNKNAQLV